MNVKLLFPIATIVVADAIGLVASRPGVAVSVEELNRRVLGDGLFSPFIFLCAFLVLTMASDAMRLCLRRRTTTIVPRLPHSGYRQSARALDALGPSNWVFKEAWRKGPLLLRGVLSFAAAVALCNAVLRLLGIYIGLLPMELISWAYWIVMGVWIVAAHIQYLASFVILTVDGPELRITRLGARDQGRAESSTIANIRAIGGVILVPYRDSLWLNKPLAETKRGRYVVLRPNYPDSARLILEQIRGARDR